MSNIPLEPCTRVRDDGRAPYVPPLRHLSLVLTGGPQMIGRAGPTICGLPGAADQERALYLVRLQHPLRNIKIHELRPCRRCHTFPAAVAA
jgi:hypothetical protein